jgi:phenylacetate-CoA ligase
MSIQQAIYQSTPRCIQSLLLNVQAFRYLRQRRGGQYKSFLDWLLRFQWADEDTILKWQLERFRKIFNEAGECIPYYRKLFKDSGFRPQELTGFEQLRQLPFLYKHQIRENMHEFANCGRKSNFESHTGGTTGAPMATPWDLESLRLTCAIMDRFYLAAGVSYFQRSAHLAGQMIAPHREKRRFWRTSWVDKSVHFSIYHLNPKNLPLYFKKMQEFNILWIEGYTSFIYDLAQWINGEGLSGKLRLAAVFPTTETLTQTIRDEIERAFGCPVFNHYGATEGTALATQCPAGRMHIVPESGIMEFVREDGTAAEAGEVAEIAVTSFRNLCRPLLRYRIGDMAIYSEEKCPCGRNWPVVQEFAGRNVEQIKTPDGRNFYHFSHLIFKVTSKVKQSQIIQLKPDEFVFKIIKGPGYDAAEEKLIRKRFREVLGCDSKIDIQYVDEIPRLSNGKRPSVISHVDKNS